MAASLKGTRRIVALVPVALMPAGALAVHELRYLLAYGSHASAAMAQQGHAYLHSLVPWIILSLGLVLGGFARALGRAWSGQRSRSRYAMSFAGLWLVCTVSLLVIYTGQETLEGLFATGHPAGWLGIFGYGGWWAVAASLCVGLVLAAAYHGARWVLAAAARRTRRRRAITGAAPRTGLLSRITPPRLAPVADGWSGRGPPR